jgi:hypothetical protein
MFKYVLAIVLTFSIQGCTMFKNPNPPPSLEYQACVNGELEKYRPIWKDLNSIQRMEYGMATIRKCEIYEF